MSGSVAAAMESGAIRGSVRRNRAPADASTTAPAAVIQLVGAVANATEAVRCALEAVAVRSQVEAAQFALA